MMTVCRRRGEASRFFQTQTRVWLTLSLAVRLNTRLTWLPLCHNHLTSSLSCSSIRTQPCYPCPWPCSLSPLPTTWKVWGTRRFWDVQYVWQWHMTVRYDSDVWQWRVTVTYDSDVWQWRMTVTYGSDVWRCSLMSVTYCLLSPGQAGSRRLRHAHRHLHRLSIRFPYRRWRLHTETLCAREVWPHLPR